MPELASEGKITIDFAVYKALLADSDRLEFMKKMYGIARINSDRIGFLDRIKDESELAPILESFRCNGRRFIDAIDEAMRGGDT